MVCLTWGGMIHGGTETQILNLSSYARLDIGAQAQHLCKYAQQAITALLQILEQVSVRAQLLSVVLGHTRRLDPGHVVHVLEHMVLHLDLLLLHVRGLVQQDICAFLDRLISMEGLPRLALALVVKYALLDTHALPLRKRYALLEHIHQWVKQHVPFATGGIMEQLLALRRRHVLEPAQQDMRAPLRRLINTGQPIDLDQDLHLDLDLDLRLAVLDVLLAHTLLRDHLPAPLAREVIMGQLLALQ